MYFRRAIQSSVTAGKILSKHCSRYSLLMSQIILQYALSRCVHPSSLRHFSAVVSQMWWPCSDNIFFSSLRRLLSSFHPPIFLLQQLFCLSACTFSSTNSTILFILLQELLNTMSCGWEILLCQCLSNCQRETILYPLYTLNKAITHDRSLTLHLQSDMHE